MTIQKIATLSSTALTLALSCALLQPPSALGQPPAAGAPKGKAPDPRVQQRTYRFTDTNEDLPYALFVSSKVSKDKKAPLIVALHGVFGDGNALLRGEAIDLAEAGGYILVGPMGYNPQGWYGSPVIVMNGPPGQGKGKGTGAAKGGPPPTPEPPNLAELSEKDVMNVLAIMRKEFMVDDKRTYLMGHSMGGAGSIFLGVKYQSIWAAVGAEAPATSPAGLTPDTFSLEPARNIPVIIVQGDMDTLVPVAGTRLWIEKLKELNMTYQYVEVAGGDHGSVLTTGAPDIFAFFAKHTKAGH